VSTFCRLCGEPGELQESHILPAFVFRWLKETSGTGYIRLGQQPNRRVQDGFTKPWLCLSCEGRLNVWETKFANTLFHSENHGGDDRVRYSEWLLKFCVSVSWRSLSMMIEETGLKRFSGTQRTAAARALETWRRFLLDQERHPGPYEQHLWPFYSIERVTGDFPANFCRYILRGIEIDAVHGERTAFIYSKLGRFVIVGFIDVRNPKEWVGSKIHVREGFIEPREYTMPAEFADYLKDHARRYSSIFHQMSDAQLRKIDEAYLKDMDRAARSGTFQAMTDDVRLFGKKAFEV
jgi:hypothetical protein